MKTLRLHMIVIEPLQYMSSQISRMNAIAVKQLLWSNEEIFETESRLSQSLNFKTYKIYLNAVFTHVVLKLCKNKNLRYWFKATLALETRIACICNTHGYQRNLRWSWNATYITIRWDTASWFAQNSCEKRYSNCFYLRSLMITKGQIQVSIRLNVEVGWVPWGSFVDLHWSISFAYTWNILLTCKLWNWGGIAPLPSLATRLVATVFWLRATDQRSNSW